MIEFAMIKTDTEEIVTSWINLSECHETPAKFWFDIHRFKINGVLYSKWSDEFVDAYNKHRVWQKLND